MLRGRSQLVESFVSLVPPARIDRLIALSLSWCMAVLRSWSQLSGYSRFRVHFEKEERRREKEKSEKRKARKEKERKRDQEKKRTKIKAREKEKERTKIFKKNHKPKNPPDELSHHDSKKKGPARRNYSAFFFASSESQSFFSIYSMIRIRFSGSQELIWKAFSGARYSFS